MLKDNMLKILHWQKNQLHDDMTELHDILSHMTVWQHINISFFSKTSPKHDIVSGFYNWHSFREYWIQQTTTRYNKPWNKQQYISKYIYLEEQPWNSFDLNRYAASTN